MYQFEYADGVMCGRSSCPRSRLHFVGSVRWPSERQKTQVNRWNSPVAYRLKTRRIGPIPVCPSLKS